MFMNPPGRQGNKNRKKHNTGRTHYEQKIKGSANFSIVTLNVNNLNKPSLRQELTGSGE